MNNKVFFPLISLFLLLAGSIMPESAFAQISEGGTPASFRYHNSLKSDLPTVQIPVKFSVEDLKTVDAWQVSQGTPLKVSTLIDTDLSIENAGNWTTLPDGKKIWQLRLQAKGAIALMLYYKEFHIPEGGRLFIYNADKSQLIGAFTHNTNPVTSSYATEFIAGDDLVLEYEAAASGKNPRIHINEIGYGYNHLSVSTKSTSGSCMVNINCEEGDAWQKEKKGVCRIIEKIGKYTYLCSGSLVNNTNEDLAPYILSAFHCTENEEGITATANEYNQWIFHFNYEYTDCEGTIINKGQTMTGATKKAFTNIDSQSDGLLLLLNQQIPESYDVYYNGWDRSETPAQSGVSIHHPAGDYKKISSFNSPAFESTWFSVVEKDTTIGDPKAHWDVIFEQTTNGHSITEGGSSGSPLFNQNGLVVGTLSGGNSSCQPDELEGDNLYGKLSYHWNKYTSSDSTQMNKFLDPANKNVTKLEGRYASGRKPAPSDLKLSYKQKKINMSWNAPSPTEGLEKYLIYDNNTLITETTSTSYTYDTEDYGKKLFRVSAYYADGKESAAAIASIDIPEYKSPTDVTATMNKNDVIIKWEEPEYLQSIYWGTIDNGLSQWSLGTEPIHIGQLWETSDLALIDKKQIKYIVFFPVKGASYSIVILQGNNKYTQKVDNPVYNTLNTVELKTPFVIDSKEDMIVSIHISNIQKGVYPIICDQGPAVNMKGNIVSEEGEKWQYFYSPEEGFDCNFLVIAVVSSQEGTLTDMRSTSSGSRTLSKSAIDINTAAKPLMIDKAAKGFTTRSQTAYAFPEITGYSIYRNGQKIGDTSGKINEYTDKNVPEASYIYAVSTLYNEEESRKISIEKEISVDNEKLSPDEVAITPTRFSNQVQLMNNSQINLLEVISATGKTVIRQEKPASVVDTNSLPSGIYFFRLYTGKGIKVIKGIKTAL